MKAFARQRFYDIHRGEGCTTREYLGTLTCTTFGHVDEFYKCTCNDQISVITFRKNECIVVFSRHGSNVDLFDRFFDRFQRFKHLGTYQAVIEQMMEENKRADQA